MRFRARYSLEYEVEFEAGSPEEAASMTRNYAAGHDARARKSIRVLGVVPASESWPVPTAEEVASAPRPPRNTPPSGSPGTPTARLEAQIVEARAA